MKVGFKTQDKFWSGKTTVEIPRKFEVQTEISVNHDSVPFWRRDSNLFERESFRSLALLMADVRLQRLSSIYSHSIIFTFSIEDEDVDVITSISEEEEEERHEDAIEGSSEKGCDRRFRRERDHRSNSCLLQFAIGEDHRYLNSKERELRTYDRVFYIIGSQAYLRGPTKWDHI